MSDVNGAVAASEAFRTHVGLDAAKEDDDGNVVLPDTELEPSGDEKDDDEGDDKDDAAKAPAKKSSSKKG